ncbi:Aste57867_1801 [Aphanomyces stellatus]|uniref:Aste57867_1801 protein n=1 Tax=Aphanomyces stellatus TaxID=120398 RepID=A0A485KBG6_9STRA|nr:hypothetical protein As57867_001799 [Aphanomyces stellatus]VFT79010.1 Aste57867_1801 [Aphanomyces stellatus]
MTLPVVLFSYAKSSCSWRVRIALAWKGIEYEYRSVNTQKRQNLSPDYAAMNPNQRVPLLYIDNSAIAQSSAILAYLEETRPTPPLLPSTPLARANVRALCDVIGADIQPLQNRSVLGELEDVFKTNEAYCNWLYKWPQIKQYEDVYEFLKSKFVNGDDYYMFYGKYKGKSPNWIFENNQKYIYYLKANDYVNNHISDLAKALENY